MKLRKCSSTCKEGGKQRRKQTWHKANFNLLFAHIVFNLSRKYWVGEQARERERERQRLTIWKVRKGNAIRQSKLCGVEVATKRERDRGEQEGSGGGHSQCQKLTCVVTLILLVQAKEKQNEGKTLQQVPQDMKGWQRVERGRAGQVEGAAGLTESWVRRC